METLTCKCGNEMPEGWTRCLTCSRDAQKKWAQNNPDKIRASQLKNKFKLTPEQFDAMLESQGGVCDICKQQCRLKPNLCVDHDQACCPGRRSCGECVRGLLCMHCNAALGRFGDDIETLQSAIRYLEKWKP